MADNPHYHEFLAAIRSAAPRHDLYNVFSDFCELAAISLSNAVAYEEEREQRYLELAKSYGADIHLFPELLAMLTLAMEEAVDDHLGKAFHELELANKWRGQFFTPYELCRMMAKMQIAPGMEEIIARRGFVLCNEPACGAGAMVIALCQEMREAGLNYQTCLHVTAQDIDIRAVHMAYVQLSLLHCPATLIHGDTLALETRSLWYTPAHVLGFWDGKLARHAATVESAAAPQPELPTGAQYSLF